MRALAEQAARAAGAIIQGARATRVVHKGAVDLVTEVDLACEQTIAELLVRGCPGVPVVGEEAAGSGSSLPDSCWIVDPLDGTTNFVHGYPAYGVSIALQQAGQVQVGCVLDAVRGQLFSAQRGAGASCDGEPMRVSGVDRLDRALLLTGFGYDRRERAAWYLSFFEAFLVRAQGVRRAGAAALDLAWLASGRADGFWELGLKAWDVAAGMLLVQEAGGRVTNMDGTPLSLEGGRLLASNGQIHASMLAVLQEQFAAGRC